ncbi:ABC transporter ATP-binding protein [Tessaracoccus sp. OH4464_COT-324]|uniref:ABC transporter ATP-binding protein n=1 Tax=Tessaracoccus sp. OH4464_COT-324 TaxID=2491059 RepID=UPI000F631144|nr:ABC transporter ATP-binding protein [Tessaracoccus sp. OH4464_COT-324]RRD47441.1 ABC transporter ATP-binding protein [Tessaracoccus sp. OH4464_COT-324]
MSLVVQNLTIKFADTTVVDDVSFAVGDGERLGIIGASGSGKSVTALAVAGLLSETARISGSIRLDGQELVGMREKHWRKLRGNRFSMVFQEPMTALDPTMPVGRQIAETIGLHSRRTGKRRSVEAELERVGISDPRRVADSFPHELSGGQRQRALIAMAIVNQPDLVICDEPTTALDVLVQRQILDLLDEVLVGRSALFITHDLAVVRQVCPRAIVMQSGRIVEEGLVDQLINQPRHDYTRALVTAAKGEL